MRYTGGALAEQTLPMLVVLHGLGDNPAHFVRLYEGLPAPARVVAPRAWARYHSGYSWFAVDLSGDRAKARAANVRKSAARLAHWLKTLPERYPTRGKPIVSGFSQGGMLTFALVARHPDTLGAAFPIGGTLDPGELPAGAPADAPPLWAFHGERDPLVPVGPTRHMVTTMKQRGYDARITSYPQLGHSIHAKLRQDLYAALADAVGATMNNPAAAPDAR